MNIMPDRLGPGSTMAARSIDSLLDGCCNWATGATKITKFQRKIQPFEVEHRTLYAYGRIQEHTN